MNNIHGPLKILQLLFKISSLEYRLEQVFGCITLEQIESLQLELLYLRKELKNEEDLLNQTEAETE